MNLREILLKSNMYSIQDVSISFKIGGYITA